MSRFFITLTILLLFTSSGWSSDDQEQLSVIPLHYRPADTIVPTLQQFIRSPEIVTAAGNQIVIQASSKRTQEIIALIKQLDHQLAQFDIFVKQSHQGQNNNTGIAVNGQVGGNQASSNGITTGTFTVNGQPVTNRSSGNTVTVHREVRTYNAGTQQKVRATEGFAAFIKTGKDIPYNDIRRDIYDRYSETQEFKEVVSGFYVTPLGANDRGVTLSISTSNDKISDDGKSIDIKRVSSNVYAPYNEWIAIGGSTQNGAAKDTGIANYESGSGDNSNVVYVKIIKKSD